MTRKEKKNKTGNPQGLSIKDVLCIIDTIREPIVILDLQQNVKIANTVFYKNFNILGGAEGRSLYELGNGMWNIPGLRGLLEDIIIRDSQLKNFGVDIQFPDTGRKMMLLNACQFNWAGENLILLAVEDIADRKKLEELRSENERLIFANKTRSEFLAIMSHELRTPLTSVIGYSLILQGMTQGTLNEKQKLFVDNILKSSKHLLTLINNILDMAKMEAGKLEMAIEEISVPDTINEILNLIKENASEHNVVLKKEFDPEILAIKADRRALKQIFFNLLSNAIKFSKLEGGIVTVSLKREGDMVKISVSDTGIGIKEVDVPRLFHEFEQLDSGTSRKYDGTGLGLAITKNLVELHGGKIWVESVYGEGSKFIIMLPITEKKENDLIDQTN